MEGIKIEYIDHLGDDLRIVNSARVSFNNWKEEFEDKDVKLLDYLAKHEHSSPFRNGMLTVRCTAPIFLARQLAKHVVGFSSWNEVSRRYVSDSPEFFVPDEWRKRPEKGIKQGSSDETVSELQGHPDHEEHVTVEEAYSNVLYHCNTLYETMIRENVAPEMARMVLPQSMLTSWIWTGSLQAFFHLWRLRIDGHAQKEAQVFAEQVGEICQERFPHSWEVLTKYAG